MAQIHGEAGLVRITAKLDTTRFDAILRSYRGALDKLGRSMADAARALAPLHTGSLAASIRSQHINCRSTMIGTFKETTAMHDTTIQATAELIAAGTAVAEPHPLPLDAPSSLVIPEGFEHVIVHPEDEFAHLKPTPARVTGDVNVDDVDSLLAYIDRHGDDDATIWADADSGKFRAVLNDHARRNAEGERAGWGDHRAHLQLRTTPEWDFWMRLDGKLVEQDDFAEHIEDGQRELHSPDPATMLDIAQSFQATSGASFKKATRVQDGQVQLNYTEDVQAAAGAGGDIAIPATFQLAIAPYVGCPAYAVTARFRWRLRGAMLTLGYKLDRPEDVKRDAIKALVEKVREAHGDRVFLGRPR